MSHSALRHSTLSHFVKFFAYMAASSYQVDKITSLDKNEFLDTHVCINNPY